MSPQPWLRGPVEHVAPALQPVAHALQHAREELERLVGGLSAEQAWSRPAGLTSIGWHVRHSMGSIDRFLTYARGEGLSEEQFRGLAAEQVDAPELDGNALLQLSAQRLAEAEQFLRQVDPAQLDQPRQVGRKLLPSTLGGILFHLAEHTARHVGQIATTAKLVR